MTVSSQFSFCIHRRVCSFFPHFLPWILLSSFVKMHWALWVPYYFFSFMKFGELYDTLLSLVRFTITKTLKKPHSTTDSHHSSRQEHEEWKEGQRSGLWWRVTLHVQTCSSRNRIIALMWRPNTDSAPNKPVTCWFNRLLDTSRGHESRPHCHDTVLRYAETLQVWIHPKAQRALACTPDTTPA